MLTGSVPSQKRQPIHTHRHATVRAHTKHTRKHHEYLQPLWLATDDSHGSPKVVLPREGGGPMMVPPDPRSLWWSPERQKSCDGPLSQISYEPQAANPPATYSRSPKHKRRRPATQKEAQAGYHLHVLETHRLSTRKAQASNHPPILTNRT